MPMDNQCVHCPYPALRECQQKFVTYEVPVCISF
jgi:hypothetical protein